MSDSDRTADTQRRARSFGSAAETYHRGRPDYPEAAVAWLLGESQRPLTVVELGAGTGKLTAALVAGGHDVLATDPDKAMLAELSAHLPDVRTGVGTAERIAVPDASVDVVIAAQCFHWFDVEPALAEIARVLRPGGHVALVWNLRDERIPWVRKLGRIIGAESVRGGGPALEASEHFGDVEHTTVKHWQGIDRRSVVDLATSRSNALTASDAERQRLVTDLLALYDDYGRGMDGMQLPYVTDCYRAQVVRVAVPEPDDATDGRGATQEPRDPADAPGASGDPTARRDTRHEPTVPLSLDRYPRDPLTDSAATLPRVATEPIDDGSLTLISFR